jgi:hypothetical protein
MRLSQATPALTTLTINTHGHVDMLFNDAGGFVRESTYND